MTGRRGLAVWSASVAVLAGVALVARSGAAAPKAVALATLAAVVGVLATRGLARRAICLVVSLLGVVLVSTGAAAMVASGGLLVLGGVLGALRAGGWPVTGRRYEAKPDAVAPQHADLWSRIDAGDDPTR